MNALDLLKDDHLEIDELFAEFEASAVEDVQLRRRIVDQFSVSLARHAVIEEQVFYPAARTVPGLGDAMLEALEEHHMVKLALAELERLPANAERFEAKVSVLIENVRHHVEEEEGELFPQIDKAMSSEELGDLGMAMQRAKSLAPTRPHPLAPDTPPLNVLVGIPVAVADVGVRVALGAARVTGAVLLQLTGRDRATRRQREEQLAKDAQRTRSQRIA